MFTQSGVEQQLSHANLFKIPNSCVVDTNKTFLFLHHKNETFMYVKHVYTFVENRHELAYNLQADIYTHYLIVDNLKTQH